MDELNNCTLENSSGKPNIKRMSIMAFLLIYSFITIFPFYILFVRTFVSTTDSVNLHLWLPREQKFDMNSKFGNMAVFLDLDTDKFKKDFNIKGYINPNLTMNELAAKYKIQNEKLQNYMQPFVSFNGWITVLKGNTFWKSLLATTFITVSIILLGGFMGICTGFVLAGFRKKWHFAAYNLYLLQIVIPPVMIMIPQFLIVTKYMNMNDSYLALILFHIKGGALSTMLFTSYIASLPKELRESVEIDGGGPLEYFWNILLPLCKVPFATFLAIQLPWFWNDLLYPLLFLKPDKYTLVALINSFVGGQFSTNFQAMYAGLFLSILPMLIIYLVFQKLFIKAALAGAVKG